MNKIKSKGNMKFLDTSEPFFDLFGYGAENLEWALYKDTRNNKMIIICRSILRFVLTALIITIVVFAMIEETAEGADFKGEYCEREGCVYLTGNLTQEEKTISQELYKQRIAKREAQVKAEIGRSHEIEIETIKAQAMKDYLIAQGIPLREIAEAYRRTRIRQNVFIGDITNTSKGGAGGSATATGTGGVSTALTGTMTNTNTNSELGD